MLHHSICCTSFFATLDTFILIVDLSLMINICSMYFPCPGGGGGGGDKIHCKTVQICVTVTL